MRCLFPWVLAAATPTLLAAQARVSNPHAVVTLVASHTTLAPGAVATLAVRFELEPGWHIYWENPGESGLATTVDWALPPGFRAGPTMYPAPRLLMVAGVASHVHEGEVWFSATLTAPPRGAARRARIAATVHYGICKDVCVPGTASLRLELPVGTRATADPSWPGIERRMALDRPVAGALSAAYLVRSDTAYITVRQDRGCLRGAVTFFARDRAIAPAAGHGAGSGRCRERVVVALPVIASPREPLSGVVVVGEGRETIAYDVTATSSGDATAPRRTRPGRPT